MILGRVLLLGLCLSPFIDKSLNDNPVLTAYVWCFYLTENWTESP